MIHRTITDPIEESIRFRPVTLVTGAPGVGKTTLCRHIGEAHGFGYVSLSKGSERMMAVQDPDLFLHLHPAPVVIDDIQYAPNLFDVIRGRVDEAKYTTGSNSGMYILIGNQCFGLMKGVTESMAGRVGIIGMSPLSMSEVLGREEVPFRVDMEWNTERAMEHPLSVDDVYGMIVRGGYPGLHDGSDRDHLGFHSDYVDDYIDRVVPQVIRPRDGMRFRRFMEHLALSTGMELVPDDVAHAVGVSVRTVQSWLEVLVSQGIVRLLQPYPFGCGNRREVRRPKLYFCDTGLACYLAKVSDPDMLRAGYLGGPMLETFVVNEILRSYSNNTEEAGFYHCRDSEGHGADLVILHDGKLTPVRCRTWAEYDLTDVEMFPKLDGLNHDVGPSCLICLSDRVYPLTPDVYALPISSI